jgi:hypothetical protein
MFQFAEFALIPLCIQGRVPLTGGFPHSDIPGSKLVCQLPETLRRLPRPSSPVIAKASTICTYSLDPITLKPESFLDTSDSVSWLDEPYSVPRQGVNLPVIGFLKHYIQQHQADTIEFDLNRFITNLIRALD